MRDTVYFTLPTDPEISNEELTQFILYMTEKISTFFNSIMATMYKT